MIPEINSSELFLKAYNAEKRIQLHRGGTRSGKSYTLIDLVIIWLFTGKISQNAEVDRSGIFSIIRKFKASTTASVLRDFESELIKYDLYQFCTINKTLTTYTYKDRVVEFMGADDPQKLRSATRDYLWCEEANELTFEDFFQAQIRTRKKVFLSFNPDDEASWLNVKIEQERSREKGDVDLIVSTYKDNPFLTPEIISEIEYIRETDPTYWKIYGEGCYGQIEGRVFKNFQIVPAVDREAKLLGYGLDFGFTNDPTALVAVYIMIMTGGKNRLYFDELVYEKGLLNNQIASRLNGLGIDRRDEVFADSAEPKTIEDLRMNGYNVKPCAKGADSVNYGIDLINQYDLFITDHSVNLIKEFRHYKWITDKDGKALNKPIDDYNHGIDALRYLCSAKLTGDKVNANAERVLSMRGYLQKRKNQLANS